MPERISHPLTNFIKFVLPYLWFIGFSIGTIIGFYRIGFRALPFIFPIIFGTFFIRFMSKNLKNVFLDKEFLYISNYKDRLRIPISDVKSVDGINIGNPRRITIIFKNQHEFGNELVFLGKHRMYLFLSKHPTIERLQKVIDKQNQNI